MRSEISSLCGPAHCSSRCVESTARRTNRVRGFRPRAARALLRSGVAIVTSSHARPARGLSPRCSAPLSLRESTSCGLRPSLRTPPESSRAHDSAENPAPLRNLREVNSARVVGSVRCDSRRHLSKDSGEVRGFAADLRSLQLCAAALASRTHQDSQLTSFDDSRLELPQSSPTAARRSRADPAQTLADPALFSLDIFASCRAGLPSCRDVVASNLARYMILDTSAD